MSRTPITACVGAGIFGFSCISNAVRAEDSPDGVRTVPPVVVTATRTPITADDALASVTVITRDEIERSQAKNLADVFKLRPGIDVVQSGGAGSTIGVLVRGTNSDHVLVLVDGVRASSATTGAFAWEHLAPSQIERIEIVRGPRASLYGSDAVGGVIQIFTRKGEGPVARAEIGSFSTRRLAGGWGGSLGPRARVHVNAEYEDVGGFSAKNRRSTFGFDPDDDGYDRKTATGSMEFDLGPTWRAGVRAWHAESDSEFDRGESQSTNQTVGGRVSGDVRDGWHQSLRLSAARDDVDTGEPAVFNSGIETVRLEADWQHDLSISDAVLVSVGASYRHDDATIDDFLAGIRTVDANISDGAIFGSAQATFLDWNLTAALRFDDHSEFGGETTGQMAIGRDLAAGLRVFASVGTAFKAPSVNELFFPGFGPPGTPFRFGGSPGLAPETSTSYELGLRFEPVADHRLTLDAYRTDIEDLIDFVAPVTFDATNIGEAELTGVELGYAGSHGPVRWRGAFTWQRAIDAATNTRLPLRATRKLALDLGYRPGRRLELGGELLAASDRLAAVAGRRLEGYTVVNLYGRYRISRRFRLEARLENLFDKDYEVNAGFNTPARSAFVALRYGGGE